MTGLLDRWARTTAPEPSLLVVGGASLDVLHLPHGAAASAGGAGLYTALAAARAGAAVTMLAPRPDPVPEPLRGADRFIRWVGPAVGPGDLPRFEIGYDGEGRVTRFDRWAGAEPAMTPDLLDRIGALPPVVFCVPVLSAAGQHAFVTEVSRRGSLAAANTFSCAAEAETAAVRRTAEVADIFFCNETEASLLFGSPEQATTRSGQLRFVTLGARGALVIQGDHITHVPAVPARVVDPTGAGDTFCGTVLARLSAGEHPVEAARHGVAAAAVVVTGVGPQRLLDPWYRPEPPSGSRVAIDDDRVAAMATLISTLDEVTPFPFVGEVFPDSGEPGALDFFFSATLQQFGFWAEMNGAHGGPTYANVGGIALKGSDYLWACYLRWLRDDPEGITPSGQASLTAAEFEHRLAADDGEAPLPEAPRHASLAAEYGRTLLDLGWSPRSLVAAANRTRQPLASLLRLLDHVAGYREDPLRKKSALLGIILRQRPEAWLTPGDDDSPPIVDYHVQRTCLRTGMVIPDSRMRRRLESRVVLERAEEEEVRRAAHAAVSRLARLSGKPMGAVDWFLFEMRHRCPEMSPPRCESCPARAACARDTALFQPVRRTTFY